MEERYEWMDYDCVRNEALRVRFFVRNNYADFYDPETNCLRICGTGSIFARLFGNAAALGMYASTPNYLYISDDMIATQITQCSTERAGRQMTLVKDELRTKMNDDIYNALLYLRQNLPPIQEVDYDRLIDSWSADGHLLPFTKNGSESRVMTRKLQESKKTPILKRRHLVTDSAAGRHSESNADSVSLKRPGTFYTAPFRFCSCLALFFHLIKWFSVILGWMLRVNSPSSLVNATNKSRRVVILRRSKLV